MRGALILGGALLPLLVPGVAAAQTTPQPQSTAVLSAGDTVSSGRIAINVAAGNLNQEANVAVIAAGAQTATPTALT